MLRAGAPYVPLDPAYPRRRLETLLEETRPPVVLTDGDHEGALPEGSWRVLRLDEDETWRPADGAGGAPPAVSAENPSHVIYTSGSTGRPKGVVIRHGAAAALCRWAAGAFTADELEAVVAATSICFDLSVFELFAPLSVGGRVVLVDDALALAGGGFGPGEDGAATLLNTVPSAARELLRLGVLPATVGTVNLAGEALPPGLVRDLQDAGVERVVNLYGPSEDTTYSTVAPQPHHPPTVAVGRPVDGTGVRVVGPDGRPTPLGAPGELWLVGDGLARGYLGRPALTAERFTPDPWSERPGARLYRTGDLVRHRPDGALDFLGRRDHQVKVRGHRIELGEVEAALTRHPVVREAAVVVRGDGSAARLAAFVVPAGASAALTDTDRADLTTHLERELPRYMVPGRVRVLEAMPRTATGKIDRRGLPDDGGDAGAARGAVGAAPATPTEEILAGSWADLLECPRVGRDENFFSLGGHSLLATRAVARVRRDFDVDLPLRELFEHPTVAELARRVDALRAGGDGQGRESIPPVDPAATVPLSFTQERIWFLEQLEPGTAAYHLPGAVELSGRLPTAALRGALDEVVRRHEALRAVFVDRDGQPGQRFAPPAPVPLPVVDLSRLPEAAREGHARSLVEVAGRRPFELTDVREGGRLLRAHRLRLGPERSVLSLHLHHLAADGWSVALLVRELGTLLDRFGSGRPSELPEPAVRWGEFAAWQRHHLRGEVLERQVAGWRERLAGLGTVLELPTDHPRPPVQRTDGANVPVRLDPVLLERAEALGRNRGATLFMVLLAAFQMLLSRRSGQRDFAVGTAVANRDRPELEDQIGCHFNTLVLRARLGGDPTFGELLARTRSTALAAFEHAGVPFEMLVEALVPDRDLSRSPLVQALFLYRRRETASERSGVEGGVGVTPLTGLDVGAARFDLTLSLDNHGAGSFNYPVSLFEATTVLRWARALEAALEAVLDEPERPLSRISTLTAVERHQLLHAWNDTLPVRSRGEAGTAAEDLDGTVRRRAAERPDAVAVCQGPHHLSFGELERRAAAVAAGLRGLGVGPEDRVALSLPRTPDLCVALLGVLTAGAGYLPLDAGQPVERLRGLLEDARPAAWVVGDGLPSHIPILADLAALPIVRLNALPAAAEDAEKDTGGDPGRLAYTLYTSGSTGVPKGVMVEHRQVLGFLDALDDLFGDDPGNSCMGLTGISFDISVLELFWTLSRGRTVVLRADPLGQTARRAEPARPLDLSLFYFASGGDGEHARGEEAYRLLLEGARFADAHGFSAVWIPERHFHAFGGIYPNPSVAASAVAAITRNVDIRAGSVVLPLHQPLRVAEEWAMVDNLSGGRVGISFASGWHPDDFVLAPDHYAERREVMRRGIETVRRLWRGEAETLIGGHGNPVEVRIRPRPVQEELPVWVTAAGSPDTYRMAGELGANLLTHLLFQDLDELTERVALYRRARREAGHDPEAGRVTVMLHTFLGGDLETVKETVRGPLTGYLRSSLDLLVKLARSRGEDIDPADLTDEAVERYLELGFERYFRNHGLLGTPESVEPVIERLRAARVDELGCLIDFGVDPDTALDGLRELARLGPRLRPSAPPVEILDEGSLAEDLEHRRPATLQCTPSLASLLMETDARDSLGVLDRLLVGGEVLPLDLARRLREAGPASLVNLYGPTEATVWSAAHEVGDETEVMPIGRPLSNTVLHLLGPDGSLVPPGAVGEIAIGGLGVTRGYWDRPALTAERFVPSSHAPELGGRLYRTGDLARRRSDGALEFLGRVDHQIKIRGHRVELGEIEAVLADHPAVAQAAVAVRGSGSEQRLAGFVTLADRDGEGTLEPRPEVVEAVGEENLYRLPDGRPVACTSDLQASLLYREVFANQLYIREGIRLPEDATVLDVGANVGFFTLLMHRFCRVPRVYSFEPIPPIFRTLETNVDLYGLPARVFNWGLGAREEIADLTFYPQMAGLSGRYADPELDRDLTRALIRGAEGEQGAAAADLGEEELDAFLDDRFVSETHPCRIRTLSSVIDELGLEAVDLLKIDVERAELDVLDGIEERHWPLLRQLVLEVDGRDHLEAVESRLGARGYRLRTELLGGGESRGVETAVYMVYAVGPDARPGRQPGELAPARVVEELRRHLERRLPEPMVPAALTVLDAMPLTPNGKIDRKALPETDTRRVSTAAFAPPSDELESDLAGVWESVLGLDRVGIHDNFFEVGGNSLAVVEVRNRVREVTGHDVAVLDLFRHATVSALATYLRNRAASGDGEGSGPALARARERGDKLDRGRRSGAAARQRAFQRRRRGGSPATEETS